VRTARVSFRRCSDGAPPIPSGFRRVDGSDELVNRSLIPSSLNWLRASDAGRHWLERLPRLVEECAERWSLSLERPFPYAYASLALPGVAPDGTVCVLKIQFPDRESEHEAAALALWDGDGAVRLLGRDGERHALLLERCRPGTPLYERDEDAALDVMVELLPRLWKPARGPFRSLAEEAAWWAERLPVHWQRHGRPFEGRLLDAALQALRDLPASQGDQVLLHQDLHAGNVLRAEREPWLAIDPKPLAGEREFGIAALVRGGELGRGPHHVRHRLNRLTDALGLERERARQWALVQTLAWALDETQVFPEQVEVVRWLSEA
jgi:streptomycin 6-kinase